MPHLDSSPILRCLRPTFMGLATLIFIFPAANFAAGQTETILHDFIFQPHGSNPEASVVVDAAGNLYGTTLYGGTYNYGTVFKLTPSATGKYTETVLYSFTGGDDGGAPVAGLVFDDQGNLFGTTPVGGRGSSCSFPRCGTVFKLSPQADGTWRESVIHSFNGTNGAYPLAGLLRDQNGNLYGTTSLGGTSDGGTVFELSPNSRGGWNETVLYKFTVGVNGNYPVAPLTADSAGNLYGTTEFGGDGNCGGSAPVVVGCGVVFKLAHNPDGTWTESPLHAFTFSDGGYTFGSVIFDAAGNLYGTTSGYGSGGTVFKLAPGSDGSWTLTTVHVFQGGSDGLYPYAGLVLGSDGHFYGTTREGGSNCQYGCGIVFELIPTTGTDWQEIIIHDFSGSASSPNGKDGSLPAASLVFDQAGNLYGTALAGACSPFDNSVYLQCGTVFKLSRGAKDGWSTSLVYEFTISGDGLNPSGALVADALGNLYGTSILGGAYDLGSVFELIRQHGGGWKEHVLYSFAGGVDGAEPSAGLIFDSSGNLYGTTADGGDLQCPPEVGLGCGTVFELSPAGDGKWTKSLLHTFSGGIDGAEPLASLIFDSSGNLFGTSSGGFDASSGGWPSRGATCGNVFELSPSAGTWNLSVLHNFSGGGDGCFPAAPVIFDQSGNLYGTANLGGAENFGVVFELSPLSAGGWKFIPVHAFHATDGAYPANLTLGADGKIYGTTIGGGSATCYCGVIFALSQGSVGHWGENVLYTFTGGADGGYPSSGVIFDSAGDLYGTTSGSYCGPSCPGTLFKLTRSGETWSESTIYTFGTNPFDVTQTGLLLMDSLGNLYGTGTMGGEDRFGAVFEVSPTQAPQSSLQPTGPRLQPGTPAAAIAGYVTEMR